MKLALLIALSGLACSAQSPLHDTSDYGPTSIVIGVGKPHQLAYSAVFLGAATVADAASSWGSYEANPLLGCGEFGTRQAVIKGAIIGSMLGVEWIIARRRPSMRKALAIGNWVAGSATFGAAAHNSAIK